MGWVVAKLEQLNAAERLAVAIFALGAALDLVYHSLPAGWQPVVGRYLGADGFNAHLVTLVGMVIMVVAVVGSARRSADREARKEVQRSGEESDSARTGTHREIVCPRS